MQNSKLSTKIIPAVNESWQRFIPRVRKDLDEINTANKNDNNRIRELNSYIAKIQLIKRTCEDNISEILNHRKFFLFIDPTLEDAFNALEFLRSQDNFDNDVVQTIYNTIINSPAIIKLSEELSNLGIKVEFIQKQVKPLEELIRGKKIDQTLIQESIEKTDFGDKTKKDILLYSLISPLVKRKDTKIVKEPQVTHKQVLNEVYRNKIKELCNQYNEMSKQYNPLLKKYFSITQNMSKEEKAICEAYAANPSEARINGYDNDQLAKIYMMASFKLKENIESYIESLGELNMDNIDLVSEISFLEALLKEYSNTINTVEELYDEDVDELDDAEINDDDVNVYFAFNYFYRLLFDTRMLEDNKTSINALIKKISNNANNPIEGINATPMLGVEDAENLLDKKIYIIGKRNYKLAFIRVNNSILILSMADSNDTKFDANLNRLVREYYIGLQKQINKIEQKNEEYLNMQKNVRKEHLSGGMTI